jgi:hypothetical protein
MSRFHALLALGLAVLASGLSGCAAETDATEEEQAQSVDEIRATLLGSVAGVRINGGPTVAAPGKVQRILQNIGLAQGAPGPEEGGVRCMPSYKLEMLDSLGNVKSTAGFFCDTTGPRQGVTGSVIVRGRSYLLTARDLDALDAIGREPLAIGDVLFGVDRVQIGAAARTEAKQTTERGRIARVVRSMNGDLPPDPYARMARCLPSRVVTFWHGVQPLATVSFACAEGERGVLSGSFSGRDAQVSGGVPIDAGVVFDVESQL